MLSVGSAHWNLSLDDGWQDCSQDDMLRFFEPVSETVLTISSTLLADAAYQSVLVTRNKQTLIEAGFSLTQLPLPSSPDCALIGQGGDQVVAYVHRGRCLILMTLRSLALPLNELEILAASMSERFELIAP